MLAETEFKELLRRLPSLSEQQILVVRKRLDACGTIRAPVAVDKNDWLLAGICGAMASRGLLTNSRIAHVKLSKLSPSYVENAPGIRALFEDSVVIKMS